MNICIDNCIDMNLSFLHLFVPLWRARPLFKAYVEFTKVRVRFSGRGGVVFLVSFCFDSSEKNRFFN